MSSVLVAAEDDDEPMSRLVPQLREAIHGHRRNLGLRAGVAGSTSALSTTFVRESTYNNSPQLRFIGMTQDRADNCDHLNSVP